MNPLAGKLLWRIQKKKWLADALLLGRAPDFVVKRKPPRELTHIPVFTFHVAVPERFEAQCAHVANNNYHTVDAEELKKIMAGDVRPRANSIAITFDDGIKQVWTVAYPILKKYGLKAMVFLIPGCIPDDPSSPRKTMDDVWRQQASEEEVFGIVPNECPLATWSEIKEMHDSGCIDFQSHSMWHSMVYQSDEIVDFGRPGYQKHYFGNIHVPMYQSNGSDVTERELLLGMPIYSAAPRFQVGARYFDDERLRDFCVQLVEKGGGRSFFEQEKWRPILMTAVKEYRRSNELRERMETPEERDSAVKQEMNLAKVSIESRLDGKRIEHFCFPWYKAADFAKTCAWETGHKLVYTDNDGRSFENAAGSANKSISRVDECFLRRLPGTGRISKFGTIKEIQSLRNIPHRMFPKGT